MKQPKVWATGEVMILVNEYPNTPAAVLAQKLPHTITEIIYKANQLGLKNNEVKATSEK